MDTCIHPRILSSDLGKLFHICLRKNINIGVCDNLAYSHQQKKLLKKLRVEIRNASENYNRDLMINYANNKLSFLQLPIALDYQKSI